MLAHWGFFIGRLKALILRCASLTWAVKQHSLLLPQLLQSLAASSKP